MKKNIKTILSVSLAAMDLPSSSKIDIPIDLALDARDDSGQSNSTNFDDSNPSMEGIPAYAFCWHGDKGSFSLSSRRPDTSLTADLGAFSWYTSVLPLT